MKRIKKKYWCLLLVCTFLTLALSGCQAGNANGQTESEKDGLKVVSTIFPGYDWAFVLMNGTDATPGLMMKNGVDMHSFQPTAADIVSLSDADVFIYVGGESDVWVEDALKTAQNQNMVTVNMMEVLSSDQLHLEELSEGMETDHDHEEEDEEVYDEHVWLSLDNAQRICTAIADALCTVDKENTEQYQDNLTDYLQQLTDLDTQYQQDSRRFCPSCAAVW